MEQLIEPYNDGQWEKTFAPGSDLEWFNYVHDLTLVGDTGVVFGRWV
jgi:hypothetical protein